MTAVDLAPRLAWSDWRAIGVDVRVVVTEPTWLDGARELLEHHLQALDLACSRFRPDSELVALNAARGRTTEVSPFLAEAIAVALDGARASDGDVDPTLGSSLVRLGYDRDFAELPAEGGAVQLTYRRSSHWSQVALDRAAGTVRLPEGVQLDLGATAKAWAADRAADAIHEAFGCGVLVSLGGDIALAGPCPEGGWPIRVQERPGPVSTAPDGPSETVALQSGGIATSSTVARRWRRGGEVMHHLIDPATGMPAVSVWRTVTVTAPTCLQANVATTAAIVRSASAVPRLVASGLPARLVDHDGKLTLLSGWPKEAHDEHR